MNRHNYICSRLEIIPPMHRPDLDIVPSARSASGGEWNANLPNGISDSAVVSRCMREPRPCGYTRVGGRGSGTAEKALPVAVGPMTRRNDAGCLGRVMCNLAESTLKPMRFCATCKHRHDSWHPFGLYFLHYLFLYLSIWKWYWRGPITAETGKLPYTYSLSSRNITNAEENTINERIQPGVNQRVNGGKVVGGIAKNLRNWVPTAGLWKWPTNKLKTGAYSLHRRKESSVRSWSWGMLFESPGM